MMRFRLMILTGLLTMCRLLNGCSGGGTGYQQIGGEWVYVTDNVASGREEHELNADEATFRILSNPRPGDKYAVDVSKVFLNGKVLKHADPATFELMDSVPLYSRDARHVFVAGYLIEGADPSTFQIIGGLYGRDATTVYNGNVPVRHADVESFELVMTEGDMSSTPVKYVFLLKCGEDFLDYEVTEESPAVLSRDWGRDGTSWFNGPTQVKQADYATFRPLDSLEAIDKDHSYFGAFTKEEQKEWVSRVHDGGFGE